MLEFFRIAILFPIRAAGDILARKSKQIAREALQEAEQERLERQSGQNTQNRSTRSSGLPDAIAENPAEDAAGDRGISPRNAPRRNRTRYDSSP